MSNDDLQKVSCLTCGEMFFVPDDAFLDVEFCPFCGGDVPVADEDDDD